MGAKNSAKEKMNRGSNNHAQKKQSGNITFCDEAVLLFLLAFCIILFLGNFGLAGGEDSGGNWLSNRLRCFLGITEFVFPVFLFVGAFFCIVKKGDTGVYIKCAVIFCMMTDIAALVQLLRGNHFEKLGEQAMEHIFAGGMLGGTIAGWLYSMLGFLGAAAVLIIIFVLCLVYITELSFVRGMEKQSRRVYENTREDVRRRRRNHEQHKEEQEELRRQRMEQDLKRQQERELRREELELRQQKRREQERIRREEQVRAQQKKREKIAKQMAYMEQDMREREERIRKCGKKEYVNANGRTIVTLEQPPKPVENPKEKKDIHEIFSNEIDAPVQNSEKTEQAASFTIHRGGETSQVEVMQNGVVQPEKEEPVEVVREHVDENAQVHAHLNSDLSETASRTGNVRSKFVGLEHNHTNMDQKNKHSAQISQPSAVEQSSEVESTAQKSYCKPDLSLLKRCSGEQTESTQALTNTGIKLQKTLQSFGVRVVVTNISCGPSVTRYELQPEQGVKVSKIVGLADDIKLNLAVEDIRIEAPIPGKAAVGIEVPNKKPSPVLLGDLLASKEFIESSSPLSFAVGKDIGGRVVIHDVAKMPHLLIAGATGSGKSVCINTLIMSILYKADPEKVKLIMVDPKVVELSVYNGIPHMLIPVVTDPKKAAGALNWAVTEMMERYQKLADMGVRDIKGYNEKVAKLPDTEERPAPMPQIVIIVDELADLMMVSKSEVEDAICRLAQLARAAGIHLVIATQRPSVDVITGLIKANMPSRIALSVSSGVDSRTIIDINGAEKLLGKGDMLFYPSGYPKPVRVQGAYISDGEVSNVVQVLKEQIQTASYDSSVQESIEQMHKNIGSDAGGDDSSGRFDEYFVEAGKFVIEKDKGSISVLQRMFRIGYNRAARIMDQLEEAGVVSAEEGTKPRRVLMSIEEFEAYVEEYV